jgi:hypothetical protein
MVIGEDINGQLAPFDANLELPRYVKYTREQLIQNERDRILSYKEERYDVYLKDKEKYISEWQNDSHIQYLEKEFPKELNKTDEELYNEAIDGYFSDEIGPEGQIYSTCNPNSKWDWSVIGGRWAGLIKLKDGCKPIKPINFSYRWSEQNKQEVLSENRADMAIKKDIDNLDDIVCFAIIKDGKWYEKSEMGSVGMFSNEDDTWDIQFKKLVNEISDDALITIVDCHI